MIRKEKMIDRKILKDFITLYSAGYRSAHICKLLDINIDEYTIFCYKGRIMHDNLNIIDKINKMYSEGYSIAGICSDTEIKINLKTIKALMTSELNENSISETEFKDNIELTYKDFLKRFNDTDKVATVLKEMGLSTSIRNYFKDNFGFKTTKREYNRKPKAFRASKDTMTVNVTLHNPKALEAIYNLAFDTTTEDVEELAKKYDATPGSVCRIKSDLEEIEYKELFKFIDDLKSGNFTFNELYKKYNVNVYYHSNNRSKNYVLYALIHHEGIDVDERRLYEHRRCVGEYFSTNKRSFIFRCGINPYNTNNSVELLNHYNKEKGNGIDIYKDIIILKQYRKDSLVTDANKEVLKRYYVI